MNKIPWSSFIPMENEIKDEIKAKFDEMYKASYYIQGTEGHALLLSGPGNCRDRH